MNTIMGKICEWIKDKFCNSKTPYEEMEEYKAKYQNPSSKGVADKGAMKFLSSYSQWRVEVELVHPSNMGLKFGENLYGEVLIIFSSCLEKGTLLNAENLKVLEGELVYFDEKTGYKFNYDEALCFNVGLLWHKLGTEYDDKAVASFKKYILSTLSLSNNTAYGIDECFAFKPITNWLYYSLMNGELNISSPTTFNDPFDCPIIQLLENENDDVAKLISKAYKGCLKIVCFMSNKTLPTSENFTRMPKHDGDVPEYLNELMWAHYADFHKGICIKYHFEAEQTKLPKSTNTAVSYFRDVNYRDDISLIGKDGKINMHDAFFVKSNAWEYENELRYLYFDVNGSGDHQQINIPNCISAIYFGLRCSDNDRKLIMDLMKGKKWTTVERKMESPNKVVEHDVEFYKIVRDKNCFGKLVAETIMP